MMRSLIFKIYLILIRILYVNATCKFFLHTVSSFALRETNYVNPTLYFSLALRAASFGAMSFLKWEVKRTQLIRRDARLN